jgi:hypothetical protein
VSAEDQDAANARIPDLLHTPAAVRFVRAEPLLGPLDLTRVQWPKSCDCTDHSPSLNALIGAVYCAGCCEGPEAMDLPTINWVIVGGESGPGARSMDPVWVRALRDQCHSWDVAFFFNHWGSWLVGERVSEGELGFFVRFQDGDEFHIVSDGHDIVLCGAEDSDHPKHLWSKYWADGRGNLAKRPGKGRAGRTLDGAIYAEWPRNVA